MQSPLWRIQLFGVLSLTTAERTITQFRTQMTGALLAHLAFRNGRPQSRDVLIETFWPDSDYKSGRSRLNVALTSLRQLAPPKTFPGAPELILSDTFTVALNPNLIETDVNVFETAIKRARRSISPSERAAQLEAAIACYTGDLLDGQYAPWVLPEQIRLRDLYEEAVSELQLLEGQHSGGRAWFGSKASATKAGLVVPASVEAVPTTSSQRGPAGTFTLLLAEGDQPALRALKVEATRRGATALAAPLGSALLAFPSGHDALGSAVSVAFDDRAAGTFGKRLRAAADTGYVDTASAESVGFDTPLVRGLIELVAAAYPGQVLCSQVTAALSWKRPASAAVAAIRLRDLGRVRLNDASAPLNVFQAETAGQPPAHFPPLRAVQGETGLLPTPFTRFFGRGEAVVRLVRSLTEPETTAPLVTLTGIGGIGKTRLALEVAHQTRKSFEGRVWFVSFADVPEGERAIERLGDALRHALRLPKDPAVDPLEQAARYLVEAPALLVLDNMEPFVPSGDAARLVQALRASAPHLACLATSRQPVGVAGEQAFPVGVLLPTSKGFGTDPIDEDCVRLFEDRARAVRPDYRVTQDTAPLILRLCKLLDGLPLAIELAAARVNVLQPPQMIAQMERRFTLLKSSKYDVPDRHRSLWAAIESSYRLLPPDVQRVFRCLSVFVGGWTLEAAQSVFRVSENVDDIDTVREALAELQDCSLLLPVSETDRNGPPQFRFLETLREFSAMQLSMSGEEGAVRERHRLYFARVARQAEPYLAAGAEGRGQAEWLQRLEADAENMRCALQAEAPPSEALQMATHIHRFFFLRGYAAEGKDWLLRSRNVCADAGNALACAKADNAIAILAWSLGQLKEAETHLTSARDLYRAGGETGSLAPVLNNLGLVASQNGNFEVARDTFMQSLSLYQEAKDSLRQSMVMTNLVGVLVHQNDLTTARSTLVEALSIQRAANDRLSVLRSLQNVAEVALRQKDVSASASALRESMQIRQELGDRSTLGESLATAAAVLLAAGDSRSALLAWAAAQSVRVRTEGSITPQDSPGELKTRTRLLQIFSEAAVVAAEVGCINWDEEAIFAFVVPALQRSETAQPSESAKKSYHVS